jgi:hypothetical protein
VFEISRHRHRVTPDQLAELEYAFQLNAKPDFITRRQIADKLTMPLKSVSIWFQNRRAKQRHEKIHRERLFRMNNSSSCTTKNTTTNNNNTSETLNPLLLLSLDEWPARADQENVSSPLQKEHLLTVTPASSPSSPPVLTKQFSKPVEDYHPPITTTSPIILSEGETVVIEHPPLSIEVMDHVLGEEVLPANEKVRIWEACHALYDLRRFSSPEPVYFPKPFHCQVAGCGRLFKEKGQRKTHYLKVHRLLRSQIQYYDKMDSYKEMGIVLSD